jgi:hypothetical protein
VGKSAHDMVNHAPVASGSLIAVLIGFTCGTTLGDVVVGGGLMTAEVTIPIKKGIQQIKSMFAIKIEGLAGIKCYWL